MTRSCFPTHSVIPRKSRCFSKAIGLPKEATNMDFEVGDRVVRQTNEEGGYILATRKTPSGILMAEVRWDAGSQRWIPAEELRMWDKVQAPAPAKTTPWGRTTPEYIVSLRRTLRANPNRFAKLDKNRAKAKLADDLANLSGKHKNRTKMKARKMIAKSGID